MLGFILKLAVVVVLGVLAWNYFFGTEEEKAQSAKTFGQMKEVAVSVGELAKSEKEKYDAGKYDAALDKLGETYKALREGAQKLDADLIRRIDELEKRKRELRKELADLEQADGAADRQAERKARLGRELEQLQRDSERLARDTRAGAAAK